MKELRILRDYLCYCGIDKAEYNAVKRDAYISNFRVWRILHCAMIMVFASLYTYSNFRSFEVENSPLYMSLLFYSLISAFAFFTLNEKSLLAQFWIYLSISLLFLFSAKVAEMHPENTATSFIAMLLITPMFMLDRPFFMGIVLTIASAVYLIWMRPIKPDIIWQIDAANVITFAVIGFFLHVISNSIRIKEFTLTRKLNIQKDTDDLTSLKNKGALTREINEYLEDESKDKGIMFILDIDYFKAVNDTYGHDVGDDVIRQLGDYLNRYFTNDEIVGRFGGDEFVLFIKDTNDAETAERIAREVASGVSESIVLPKEEQKVSVSIGIALYQGEEKNYSEIFKKADTALYDVKSDRTQRYKIFE